MCCRRTTTGLVALALLAITSMGCEEIGALPADGDKPFAPLNPIEGMHIQPNYKDQDFQPIFRDDQARGMRLPPAGTVPVNGIDRDPFATPEDADAWANPVPVTMDTLTYGQFLYNTHCATCHGMEGHGDGPVPTNTDYGAPPTLNSDGLRATSDGRIYHVIAYGQNAMGSYKNQLDELERWAVVNYVRALQRADRPEPIDLDRMRAAAADDPQAELDVQETEGL